MSALPTSLTALLKAGGADAVERLLRVRPDLTERRPRTLDELTWWACSGESLTACFADLDLLAHRVVQGLVACPSPVTLEGVARLVGHPADVLRPVLEACEERGLAALRASKVWVLPQLRALPLPHHGPTAAVALQSLTVAELSPIADRLGVKGRLTRKADLVAAVLDGLSQRDVVERVVAGGPEGTAELFAQLLEDPSVRVGYWSPYLRTEESPQSWLRKHALLLPSTVNWEVWQLPREPALAVCDGQLAAEPPPLTLPELVVEQVDADRSAGQATARALEVVAHTTALADLLAASPAPLLASGGVGVREVRRLAKSLSLPDRVVGRRLEVAAAAGLLGLGGSGALAPSTAYDVWAAKPLAQRWEALVTAWSQMDHHPSAALRTGAGGKAGAALVSRGDRVSRVQRASVLRGLASVEGRVEPGSLARWVGTSRPMAWSAPGAGIALLQELLEELDELGLATLGWLSPLGRAVVETGVESAAKLLGDAAPAPSREFVVSGDMTVLVTGDLDADVASELALVADVESQGTAKLYRLTEGSLRRGLDAGRTAAQLLAFLERHAVHGVPQALAYLVGDLGRRHGQLRVGALGSYVRCDDEVLLEELVGNRKLAGLQLRVLVPGLVGAAVDPGTLLEQLRRVGYLPVQEGADGAVVLSAPPAARVEVRRRGPSAAVDPRVLAEQLLGDKPVSAPAPPQAARVRPGSAGTTSSQIDQLLADAQELGFAVTLETADRVVHAWVTDLTRHLVELETLDGEYDELDRRVITSVRPLTEAEEDDLHAR